MFRKFAPVLLLGLGLLLCGIGPALAQEATVGNESSVVTAKEVNETAGEVKEVTQEPVKDVNEEAVAVKEGVASEGAGHEAAHGEGHKGSHEHHGLTHGQVMNFVWHCLNFALLLVILVKYLRKPISDSLKGRQESIAKAFEELESKKEEAAARFKEYEQKLSGMDEEAKRILENFVAQGKKERDTIIEQAKAAAERIKAQAEFYVQQELAKAKVELQKEVADAAVKMAEEIIRKNLTEQDQSRLISEYLERVVHKN